MTARIQISEQAVIWPRDIKISIKRSETGKLIPEVVYYPVDTTGREYAVIAPAITDLDPEKFALVYGILSQDFEARIQALYDVTIE